MYVGLLFSMSSEKRRGCQGMEWLECSTVTVTQAIDQDTAAADMSIGDTEMSVEATRTRGPEHPTPIPCR